MHRVAEALAWLVVAAAVVAVPGPQAAPAQAAAAEPAPVAATLEAPPAMEPGRWWRIAVQDNLAGSRVQGTVVVTSNDGERVGFGLALDSLHPMLLNYHLFPAASARAPELAYEVHGEEFQPFRFPLRDGAEWPTVFDHKPVVATVERVDGERAWIAYRDGRGVALAEGVYDAQAGWFSSFSLGRTWSGYWASMSVLAHGDGYGCAAVQPEGLRLVELAQPGSQPAQATSFPVPPSATHVALSLAVVARHTPARQQVVAPDGTVYQVEASPGDGIESLLVVKDEPAGVWTSLTELGVGGLAVSSASVFTAREVGPFGGAPAVAGDAADCAPTPLAPAVATPGVPVDVPPAWRLLAVALLPLVRWRRRAFWAAAALFTRLTPQSTVDQPMRRRILELLAGNDGLTTQEVRRSLGIGWGTTVHHLAVLERHGKAVRAHSAGRVYWACPGRRVVPRPRGTAAAVLAQIAARPGLGPSELARSLGVRHSTVIYHVGRLARSGLVTVEASGHRRRYFPAPATP